jgi:hypothetical protein
MMRRVRRRLPWRKACGIIGDSFCRVWRLSQSLLSWSWCWSLPMVEVGVVLRERGKAVVGVGGCRLW